MAIGFLFLSASLFIFLGLQTSLRAEATARLGVRGILVLCAALTVVVPPAARAETPVTNLNYDPFLTGSKLTCSKLSPCRVVENDGNVFQLWFDSKTDSEGMREISKVHFLNVQNRDQQTFDFKSTGEEAARVGENEPDALLKTQLRKDGPTDLALFAGNSPHDGDLYHYFIYDPQTRKFQKTKDAAPKLARTKDEGKFIHYDDEEQIFKLAPNGRLSLDVAASRAAHLEARKKTNQRERDSGARGSRSSAPMVR